MTITGQIGILRHGTRLIPRLIEWGCNATAYHVVVAINDTTCLSADPFTGARYRPIADYDRIYWSAFNLTPAQRDAIVQAAASYVGRPYNYWIYPPLFWQRVTGHRVDGAVAEWLSRMPNENCSQLSDDVYTRAGFHLFEDIPEIVTPGDFEALFYRLGFIQQDRITTN